MKKISFIIKLFILFGLFFCTNFSSISQTNWQFVGKTVENNYITYGNGIFVAVGNYGAISTSVDGVTWANKTSGITLNLYRVKYLNNLFVAVGEIGTLLTSPDGNAWTVQVSTTIKNLYGITYANSKFVAVGDAVTLTSSNGIAWVANAMASTEFQLDVTFGNSKFVATTFAGTIKTSPDGLNWTPQSSGTSQLLYSIVFQNNLFVVVGNMGKIITSPDGINWTSRVSGTTALLFDITFANALFVTSNADGTFLTSPDGINWTLRTSPISDFIGGISFGNGKYVAVAYGGKSLTSVDAITWALHTQSGILVSNLSVGDITYNGAFAALTNQGNIFSPDGINWTQQTGYNNTFVGAMAYDNSGKLYGVTSAGNVVISTLANQWGAPQNISGQALYDIAYGGGQFVIGANFGGVYSGTGSSTWTTASTSPVLGAITKVEYLNGNFVLLATYPSNSVVFSSANGTVLTQKGTINNYLSGIAYGNGKYVAVGDMGGIYSSPDLTTWSPQTSNTTQHLRSICYGYGYFVAVGDFGTILTSPDGIGWSAQQSGTINNLGKVISTNSVPGSRVAANPSYVVTGPGLLLQSFANSPLPINLISFTGKKVEEGNQLSWKTADEVAFSHFEIERSPLAPGGEITSGKFQKIGKVNGSSSENYEYLDRTPPSGRFHASTGGLYRLCMVDLDGKFIYSKIIFIENKIDNVIKIYPNPSSDYFSISDNSIINVEIQDLAGKTIRKINYRADNQYSVKDLPKGIYLLNTSANKKSRIIKIVTN